MGNSLGGKKSARVMKISGEILKLKTPVRAGSVMEASPGLVLLDSDAVKHYGAGAKPLEPQQQLKPRRLYFLVDLPKVPESDQKIGARRVRSSGIHMTAKDRLESLMLSRRSASDLTAPQIKEERRGILKNGSGRGGVTVRMRLPKAEVERLMAESKDGNEVAEKIARMCMDNGGGNGVVRQGSKSRDVRPVKRVGFMPITDAEIHHLVMAS